MIISTPGRVCLFGEHQDYLHLPVLAVAISLRITITGKRRNDRIIHIDLPDISSQETINLDEPIIYTEERDYFKSSLNILFRKGYTFSSGFNCIVNGKIPINAGTSSSSALVVAWINFLTRMSDQHVVLSGEQLAVYAHEAEVLEFSEPGGMMDHFATAIGGIISIDFLPELSVQKIDAPLSSFVLGNSREPKNTKYILRNTKEQIIKIVEMLKKKDHNFSLLSIDKDALPGYKEYMTETQFKLLNGTIENREITRAALSELKKNHLDHKEIGSLMSHHQEILREALEISTPKIDRMIEASIKAGAYGAKINGSGGGGCMFAYAPEDPDKVKRAIEAAGGEAFIITSDTGSREESVGTYNE